MRKTLFTALILLLLPLSLFAQKKNDKVHEAKKLYTNLRISLLNLFFNQLSGQYELQIGKSSLNLNGNYSFAKDRQGYLLGAHYRYYFTNKRTSAFFSMVANFSDYKKDYAGVVADGQVNAGQAGVFKLWGQTVVAGANLGYRKSILFGLFSLTGRVGYGYPFQINNLSWQGQEPKESQTLRQKFTFASGVDAEFSFGWHFGR